MKLVFTGLENPIAIAPGKTTILRIENNVLFSRVCGALVSGKGEEAIEPYSVFEDDGTELAAAKAFLPIVNPFELPYKHRSLLGNLPSKVYGEIIADEDMRWKIQKASSTLNTYINEIGLRFHADYEFALQWDIVNYLKTFGFHANVSVDDSLLDNLISFIDFAVDMSINEVLLFVNLKTFLSDNELNLLNERVFFHGIKVLLLENCNLGLRSNHEAEWVIDQHFIERLPVNEEDCPSSTQRRICTNGFGAVTI